MRSLRTTVCAGSGGNYSVKRNFRSREVIANKRR
jgi:hypothetical protein